MACSVFQPSGAFHVGVGVGWLLASASWPLLAPPPASVVVVVVVGGADDVAVVVAAVGATADAKVVLALASADTGSRVDLRRQVGRVGVTRSAIRCRTRTSAVRFIIHFQICARASFWLPCCWLIFHATMPTRSRVKGCGPLLNVYARARACVWGGSLIFDPCTHEIWSVHVATV